MDLKSKLGSLLHVAPYASMINDIASGLFGNWRKDNDGEKAEKYGIFSKADEAKVAKVILGMKDQESIEDIVGFLALMFNPQRKKGQAITFQHFIESVLYRNDFFSHLATLADKGAPKKKGVERKTTKTKVNGVEDTIVTETDLFTEPGGTTPAEKLLETLAMRIKEEKERIKTESPTLGDEALRKRAYERVYKRYYKGDFTTRIRMVGEDDTKIWERFGVTQERWQQFSKWAAPLIGRAAKLAERAMEDGGRELRIFIDNEAARIRADNRLTPEVWTWREVGRKLYHLPRNIFVKIWTRIMPF